MGGIGETQTAIEYMYADRNTYERIYWITAIDHASLLSGYRKMAIMVGLKNLNMKPVEMAKVMLTWLGRKQSWLVVIDNLDDINVITGLLPPNGPHQHTLLMTRDQR